MSVTFFDVKTKQNVTVDDGKIKKTKFERKLKSGSVQTRYALKADYQGRKLFKFVSKGDWDGLKVPQE
ncbi:MAG: hypothetical protein AB1454_05180 [Candidatus Auribacterota bacterium]|jgi:major membrane immunogen (membrane-anchored lipoprotein)|uniref:Uncharacterized protein n=1 Tax=Candidatus Auribacter fodinae TaxID=2093366 RepID=A0A3A4R6L3_9BACT|nr:MAG: hypothetical protein C4541_03690 [Candidatus Auribacter fodinae]